MALTQISTAGVKDDAVTSGKIPANAVGSSELADNAVDTAAIADDAITGAKMGNSSVGTDQIVNGAITGAKMGTGSVGTTQLVDGLITGAKMGNGSVGTNQLVDQAVTLAKLPHGTSSQDGKFLRANNGADPTFETVTSTTINNNADNRIITGSGTANTLEGEANFTYNTHKVILSHAATTTISDKGFQANASSNLTDGQFLPALGLNPNAGNTDRTRAGIAGVSHNGTAGMHLAFFTRHAADGSQLTSSDEKMRLDTGGRLALGTTSPSSFDGSADDLVINGSGNTGITINSGATSSTSEGNLVFAEGNGSGGSADAFRGAIQYKHGDDRMSFYTDNTERMRIDSSGKVGIGTHTGVPNVRFDLGIGVFAATGDDDASDWGADNVCQLTATGGNAANNQVLLLGAHSGGVGQIASGIGFGRESTTNWGTYLSFKYHSTSTSNIDELKEGMRLDSQGALRINSTGAVIADELLSVSEDGTVHELCGFRVNNASHNKDMITMAHVANSNDRMFMRFKRTGSLSNVGSINTNPSQTAFNTSSDYRLKENQVLISDGITRLKQLKPYKFNFKIEPDKIVDGFFAHEVTSIVPEAVTGQKDAMEVETYYKEGETLPEGKLVGDPKTYSTTIIDPQGLDYAKFTPLLTAALQEAVAKIEVLETKVAVLEAA